MNIGDSVYNKDLGRIGRVLAAGGEYILVRTTQGREQWPAYLCKLIAED